jgi:hypothetical protein
MHLLAKVVLQLPVLVPLVQQSPEPFGVVPIGQVPLNDGVVQLPPAVAERLHLNCSAWASRHRLPPLTDAEMDAINILSDKLALPAQFVPKRQDEKATPVPEAHVTGLPSDPVLSSVFWSFDPT